MMVRFRSNSDEGANRSAKLPNTSANTSSTVTEKTVYNLSCGSREHYNLSCGPKDHEKNFSNRRRAILSAFRLRALLVTGAAYTFGVKAYQYYLDNPTQDSTLPYELVAFFDLIQALVPADAALAVAMRGYWTSFVTFGTPAAPRSISWPLSAWLNYVKALLGRNGSNPNLTQNKPNRSQSMCSAGSGSDSPLNGRLP
ncbi:hypothetical protein B0H15DRAFT_932057 [Mycena belliarum]|uniref:Uncharacterized protein n=1 Tax=Mycena belliarum TaxID=1033014 RepID=A0AAD6U3S1_9AGAR|nr:hypothetical protein B0H15DRAFT_932057 [Mycena belliae]